MSTAKLAQIRQAIARTVQGLEIGDTRCDLAGAAWQLTGKMSRADSALFEQRFIDGLVEEVGKVLTREGT